MCFGHCYVLVGHREMMNDRVGDTGVFVGCVTDGAVGSATQEKYKHGTMQYQLLRAGLKTWTSWLVRQ